MKVLQVVYSGVGGNSAVAFSLIQGDVLKKWKSIIVFSGVEKIAKGFNVFCKKLFIRYYNQGNKKNYFLREFLLLKILIKEKPDIIIGHNSEVISILIFKLFFKVKIIYVDHTPYKYRNIKILLYDFITFSFFNKIIYVNKILKKIIYKKKLSRFFNKKILFIDNGVTNNKKVFNKILNKKSIKIGMLSRFSNGKRQDLLIKSLHRIKNKYHGININLELIGNGDNLNYCKNLVKKLKINKIVKFKKILKFSQIGKWLKTIDIYTHISEDEALSTSILYAMSNKRPIIASNNHGNSFLKNKQKLSAILVKNNENLIVNALINLVKNTSKQKKITNCAYILFHKKYSSRSMFDKYKSEIDKIFYEKN